jgi:hypothetical protein
MFLSGSKFARATVSPPNPQPMSRHLTFLHKNKIPLNWNSKYLTGRQYLDSRVSNPCALEKVGIGNHYCETTIDEGVRIIRDHLIELCTGLQ